MVGLVSVDGVLWKGAAAPGIDTAHTVQVQVNVEVDKCSTYQLMRVRSLFQILLSIIPCTDAERLAAFNTKSRERRAGDEGTLSQIP